MPDTRDLTAVIDAESGYPIGWRTTGRPPVFVASRQVLHASAPESQVTGTTAATVLASMTVPGGLLGKNGQLLVCVMADFTVSANVKTLQVTIGGVSFLTVSPSSTHGAARWEHWFANSNSESRQVFVTGTGTSGETASGSGSMTVKSVDTSQDFTVEVVGTLTTPAEMIRCIAFRVEVVPSE